MIDINESELPKGFVDRINRDFIYQITTILRDKPVYLSSLLLDLDRLIELPEHERQEPLKQILASLQYSIDDHEDKTIII